MSAYQEALVEALSLESGVKRASNDSAPSPDGGELTEMVLLAEDNETAQQLEVIATEIGRITKSDTSFESREAFLFNGGLDVNVTSDNFVVNGIYIPNLLAKENHYNVRVRVLRSNTPTRELDKETVYYVVDDDNDRVKDIVDSLTDSEYMVAGNPLDLVKLLDDLRTNRQFQGV